MQWAKELLDGQVRRIEEAIAKAYPRKGEPYAEVVSLGEDTGADLILVGSRGLSPLRRPTSSVSSSSIAAHAHCPVLVARGE